MASFSTQALEEKISHLSLSQDSIETLSLWITQYKAHANESVQVWLNEVRKASADKRLVLFYLANDILQNSHRREADLFLELFQDPLRHAVSLIGGQKIQTSIERMFRIWKERKVYSNAFLRELELLIEPAKKVQANEPLPDFKLPLLQDALAEFAKFEAELKVKSSHLSNLRVDISNPTASLSMLKDKSAGGQVSQHFEEASQKLLEYNECLVIEVNERINILDMLKECKIFTTYRLTELQRIINDYKTLGTSVKDLKDKLDQRLKDIDRAKSTATSDPSAKEDITDVGDMEIESDGESQEEQQDNPLSVAPRPLMQANGPGMITAPPIPHSQLHPPPLNGPPFSQLPPVSDAYRAPRPSHQQQQFTARPRPQFQNRFNRPPLNSAGRGLAQRPFSPRQQPHPHPLPHGHNERPTRSPLYGTAPHFVPPTQTRPAAPPRLPVIPHLPTTESNHIITSSPVLYNASAESKKQSSPAESRPSSKVPLSAGSDGKPSLDDRLKDMMLNKRFGDSVLEGQDQDSKPYSPSSQDQVLTAGADQTDEDDQSPPSPTSDSPHEEEPNMDNPILKALYKSQDSPEEKPPPSLVADYEDDNDELSSTDLKNILDQVKSSEPRSDEVVPTSTPQNSAQPATKTAKVPAASEIKITPTLTNLLDEIFPKISQSLISRKRKQEEDVQADSTKMPRLANTPPRPRMPPPQFSPRAHLPPPARPLPPSLRPPHPRPPPPRLPPRVPPPHSHTPLPPRLLPRAHAPPHPAHFPRPFDEARVPHLPLAHTLENRFGSPHNFPLHGNTPPHGRPRPIFQGYRSHPRYA